MQYRETSERKDFFFFNKYALVLTALLGLEKN